MISNIKFLGDYSRVDEEEKNFINKRLEKFTGKYEKVFKEMEIKLDCHMHKETNRGRPAYFCNLTVFTDHGRFHADNQEFSAEKAVYGSLDKIERQIDKHN
jgi:ribosome-associated translation inhibitor RaiA